MDRFSIVLFALCFCLGVIRLHCLFSFMKARRTICLLVKCHQIVWSQHLKKKKNGSGFQEFCTIISWLILVAAMELPMIYLNFYFSDFWQYSDDSFFDFCLRMKLFRQLPIYTLSFRYMVM